MSNPTKIENQIEQGITGKICISEMVLMIDRFIKGLKALNISPNELKIILDLLKKLNDEPRIELIDRLMRFNQFTNKSNIKLITEHKNCVLNTTEYISNGKNLKIKPI